MKPAERLTGAAGWATVAARARGRHGIAGEKPTGDELAQKKSALLSLFDRLLPVVDVIADGFRFAAILGLALVAWIFVWMFHLRGYELGAALAVAGLLALPILVLVRFWWGMEGLKELPAIVADAMDDVRDEVAERVRAIRMPGRSKLGLLGSARGIWKLRGLVGEARQLLGSYVRVGTLVSPLSLLLGFLSLVFVAGLVPVGLVLAALQAF